MQKNVFGRTTYNNIRGGFDAGPFVRAGIREQQEKKRWETDGPRANAIEKKTPVHGPHTKRKYEKINRHLYRFTRVFPTYYMCMGVG